MFTAEPAAVYPSVEEQRYLALLRAANAIATCSDCSAASETLTRQLREVTPFDFLHLAAFDAETKTPAWSVLEANGKTEHGPIDDPLSLQDSPICCVYESGRPLVTADWSEEAGFQKYRIFLAENGIASTCTLPLTRGSRRLGGAEFGQILSPCV